jgi:hypothetical protein
MSILASLILLFFIAKQVHAVRSEPAAIGWVIVGYFSAALYLIPLVAVWL